MEWFTEHWDMLVGIIFSALTLASAITKLTPTPKDDEWVRRIISWLSFLQPKGAGSLKLPLTKPKESPPFENLRD